MGSVLDCPQTFEGTLGLEVPMHFPPMETGEGGRRGCVMWGIVLVLVAVREETWAPSWLPGASFRRECRARRQVQQAKEVPSGGG